MCETQQGGGACCSDRMLSAAELGAAGRLGREVGTRQSRGGASFLPGGYLGEKGALRAVVLVAQGCRAESWSKKWPWGHVSP